ncbi:MAG: AGE family epimerase/isomerase [Tetrasphaera sp.]
MTDPTAAPATVCSPEVAAEFEAEADRLLEFTRGAAVPGGFGWLGDDGRVVERDLELWITCRMTHVCALGHLLGKPGYLELVEHGIAAVADNFHDEINDGWYAAIAPDGSRPTVTDKQAYAHSFVILAGSSGQVCGAAGADDLLATALAVHDRRFWDDRAGMARESFSADWRTEEDYRGINANMHTVEAYLAAGDVTGDRLWHERAGRIVTRAIDDFARDRSWRIPEHFTAGFEPLPDYNRDEPAHPFRPYGATPGHALEWTRLTLSTAATLGGQEWDWALPAATALTENAIADAWDADGAEGFVYTTDWDGAPVVRARMHWVLTEALGAAWALHHAGGGERWEALFEQWWRYAQTHLVDAERGSWHAELAPDNTPYAGTWAGKPDTYHALQAMLLPRLPLVPSFASALAVAGHTDLPS